MCECDLCFLVLNGAAGTVGDGGGGVSYKLIRNIPRQEGVGVVSLFSTGKIYDETEACKLNFADYTRLAFSVALNQEKRS